MIPLDQSRQGALRVASYNIRKAVGLDWRRDHQRILDVLAEIDADVVVLQEADKRLGLRPGVLPEGALYDALGYVFAPIADTGPSHGWHGNAVLYRKSRFQLEETQKISLPRLEPRGAVSALFVSPGFEIIGAHLGLTPRVRTQQLRSLADRVARATHPVLLAGDFNSALSNARLQQLFGTPVEALQPGRSFHAALPMIGLDRFVLKGFDGASHSFVHASALARKASDHLPIVADVTLPEV